MDVEVELMPATRVILCKIIADVLRSSGPLSYRELITRARHRYIEEYGLTCTRDAIKAALKQVVFENIVGYNSRSGKYYLRRADLIKKRDENEKEATDGVVMLPASSLIAFPAVFLELNVAGGCLPLCELVRRLKKRFHVSRSNVQTVVKHLVRDGKVKIKKHKRAGNIVCLVGGVRRE